MDNNEFLGNYVEQNIFHGKRALLKTDLGTQPSHVLIKGIAKSVCFLQNHGAKVLIITDVSDNIDQSIADVKSELSKNHIALSVQEDGSGHIVAGYLKRDDSGIVLLRYFKGFEREFQLSIAASAAIFVNDSLGDIDPELESPISFKCIGFQLRRELELLTKVREEPQKPFTAVIAGDRLSKHLSLMYALLERIDQLVVAGDMMDTFLRAQGQLLGTEAVEPDMVESAVELLAAAENANVTVLLPRDVRILPSEVVSAQLSELVTAQEGKGEGSSSVGSSYAAGKAGSLAVDYATHPAIQLGVKRVPLSVSSAPPGPLHKPMAESVRVVPADKVPSGWMAVDIGPDTVAAFCAALTDSATVLWTGTLGKCIHGAYADGTLALLKYVSQLTQRGTTSVLAGHTLVQALQWELAQPRGYCDRVVPPALEQASEGGVASKTEGPAATSTAAAAAAAVRLQFTHVCSGDDAALRVLEGKPVPAISLLSDA